MRWRSVLLLPAVLATQLAACKPDLGSPSSLVVGARILGIKTEPPEARPGESVTSEVLAVTPGGRLLAPNGGISWRLCMTPKPPAENNVVNHACASGEKLEEPSGEGVAIAWDIPTSACALHGPNSPPVKPGELPLRPRDADVTGGYYQPMAVSVGPVGGALMSFALERLRCDLPNVSTDIAAEYQKRYKPNTNPVLLGLALGNSLIESTPAGGPPGATLTPGLKIELQSAWSPESRELFPVYDPSVREIVDHAEELTISWFATAGEFDRDRTGRTEAETDNTVSNTWVAPTTPGPVTLWLVLRDNRGGVDFREYHLQIAP